jgi:hypothetical protein
MNREVTPEVAERMREAEQAVAVEDRQHSEEAGHKWACEETDARALKNLKKLDARLTGNDRDAYFEQDENDAYSLPGTRLWVVGDDTLCHKWGAKVAFGGIFLDAVLSTRRHKVLRFGTNWVLLGVIVELTCRPDRYFCLPILWRVYQKQGPRAKHAHRTKRQLAADMLAVLAGWLPQRQILAVADSAYIGKHLLRERPANVDCLGPIHWKAGLYEALAEPQGRRRHGGRWPTLEAMLADDERWPRREQTITFQSGRERALEIKVITGCCWYAAAGPRAVQVVLVHDPQGQWRDEALVSTDVTLPAAEVITGYCRRWSVETAHPDSTSSARWCGHPAVGYNPCVGAA